MYEERETLLKDNLKQLEELSISFTEASRLLKSLPRKLRHPIIANFAGSTQILVKGELIHTNEVTIQLSNNYLVRRTAQNALTSIERRQELSATMKKDFEKELAELETKKMSLGGSLSKSHIRQVVTDLDEPREIKSAPSINCDKPAANTPLIEELPEKRDAPVMEVFERSVPNAPTEADFGKPANRSIDDFASFASKKRDAKPTKGTIRQTSEGFMEIIETEEIDQTSPR